MTDKELLELILKETHCSQAYIARVIGVTRQYVSLVCKGQYNLSPDKKAKLRDKFPQYFNITKLPTTLTGESVKQFRIGNQYTQARFANLLDISQSMLARIESNDLSISKNFENNFYRVFAKETDTQSLYYCPEVSIPNNFVLPKHPEVIKVDKRLLHIEKGLNVDFSNTYIVSVSGDSLKPEYENNDRVLLDTSHTSFKNGYIYLICIDANFYVVRVNVSPDKVKCIPLNDEQDAFYLSENRCKIVGLIVPRIRL